MENNDIIISDRSPKEHAVWNGWAFVRSFFRKVRDVFVSELKSDSTPDKAARSFALGIFLGIFPIFGFQTVAAVLTARLFRLNIPLAVLGTVVLIPFIIPIVFASIWLGLVIFPASDGSTQSLQTMMALFSENKSAFFVAGGKYFITGCTLISVLSGGLAYFIAYPICKMVKKRGRQDERN